MMKKSKSLKKPFFSKLLEAQKIKQTKDLKGGAGIIRYTQKAPSDNDEN